MPSLDSPSSRANFLPSKRAPARVLVPSLLRKTTAALWFAGALRSTTFPGTLASTVLPCMMLTSTLGPLPSHWSLYSPGLSLAPLMMVGFCKVKLAFEAANALEASSRANPITRLLETVANFIAAPFSFPEVMSGKRLGRPGFATKREKTLVFPHESHRMLPLGLNRQATSLLCRYGGFLTWAAKPSVRESPDPAKYLDQFWPASPLRRPLFTPGDYASTSVEVPFRCDVIIFSWTLRISFR